MTAVAGQGALRTLPSTRHSTGPIVASYELAPKLKAERKSLKDGAGGIPVSKVTKVRLETVLVKALFLSRHENVQCSFSALNLTLLVIASDRLESCKLDMLPFQEIIGASW